MDSGRLFGVGAGVRRRPGETRLPAKGASLGGEAELAMRETPGESDGARIGWAARLATGLGLVTALMLAQCACQSNRPVDPGPSAVPIPEEAPKPDTSAAKPAAAEEKKPVELPASVDPKDLDEDEKALLRSVFEEQYDPCGKSRSFLESLADPATCEEAKKLAALAVTKVADGLSKRQVVQKLLEEQSRWAKKADFDVTGSPFSGDPATAKKVIVEFFDYQCPHCKLAAKPAKELAKKLGAVIYYKMLPLDHHPHAKEAALYALAAHRQGRFEALHELLFEHQDELDPKLIRELAKKAGVDLAKLDAELKAEGEGSVRALLARDLAESESAKVGGTPTFYVDGIEVEFDQLEDALK